MLLPPRHEWPTTGGCDGIPAQLLKHTPWTLCTMLLAVENDHPGLAIAYAHSWTLEDLERLRVMDSADSSELLSHLTRLQCMDVPPGIELTGLLHEAANRRDAAMPEAELVTDDTGPPPPVWPAGFIDSSASPVQFRGFTILSGQTGVGKSKVAMRSALLAAEDPSTFVIVINAELDDYTANLYARQASGMTSAELRSTRPNFRLMPLDFGTRREDLTAALEYAIPDGYSRVLIVADTLNSIVEKTQAPRESYFDSLRAYGMLMLQSRQWSGGRIAWLMVSELNKDDRLLGGKLDKWSDVHVRFKSGPSKNHIVVDLLKARYGGNELGDYRLDWERCRIVPIDV